MRPALILLAVVAVALAMPAAASAAEFVPGEVIVKYKRGTGERVDQWVEQETGTDVAAELPGGSAQLEIEDGESVAQTLEELRSDPNVAYAVPNYVAHASQLIPNDPGWNLQWNLGGPFGINMPEAWIRARELGAPGGRGAVVAVLDTGVAYRRRGRFRRAPDLHHFVPGYDFVDYDPYPLDLNGHGTHVSGTIAESTNNERSVAGVAYRAKIMPLRVLDADGAGDTVAISRAIRYATRRRAHVINLSLEFDSSVRASQIPDIVSALRYARRHGVVVVAAAGNQADGVVAYPARAQNVIAVGATTERGCQAEYSNGGDDLDVSAPGGGVDTPVPPTEPDYSVCRPDLPGADIFQETFTRNIRTFGLPDGYEGTSMATPHVSGIAALLIATHRVPARDPRAVELQIEQTARDLGAPGFDERYGWGLVDAAAALR